MRPLPARALGVLFSPLEIFAALKEEPRVMGALLLGMGLAMVSSLLLPLELFEAMIREGALAAGEDLPLDDPARMARVFWVLGGFAALVGWPLLVLVSSGIVAAVFLFALGWEASFRQVLAVVAHALLVVALGGLLLVPLRIATGDPSVDLSVATLLPFLEEGLLRRFLELLRFFDLWAYALMGAGAAVVSGRRGATGTGVGVALAVALALSLLAAAVAGALSGVAGTAVAQVAQT